MPNIQAILVAIGVSLALGAVSAWKITASFKDSHYTAIIESQRANAERALREANDRAIKIEREHKALADKLELSHAERSKEKDRMLADNRRLASELGGLRDPGKRPACRAAVPANSGPAVAATDDPAGGELSSESAGLLSPEASEFILELARECDAAADYARTAHDWAVGLRAR